MSLLSRLPWKTLAAGLVAAIIILILTIMHLDAKLPSVDLLKDIQLQTPLKIYTADGKLIAEYGEKRRTPIKLEQVPQRLIDAIIATEDRRFYDHPGVDIRGIARAVISLISTGNKEQGGSTITMQVARNFFLTRNKTYTRKINEILLALKIEQELTKEEILELYLNKIYFGKRAYGVAAAAEVYYGTSVDKLTLGQMAMLAGLPQAPSAINPLNSPELALKRRTHVLERMRAAGVITNTEYVMANEEPISTVYHARPIEVYAPYVAEMVRQNLVEAYGDEVYDNGYQVFTTIDSKQQEAANSALTRAVLEYDQRHGYRGPIKRIALKDMAKELDKTPAYNSLIPAVIVQITDEQIVAQTKDAKQQTVTTHFKVAVGDLVYITQINKQWRLAQLPEIEAAIVAVDPNNGAIKALVGGFDYERSSFNRAVQAERQPGSSFKPFVYAAALENGFTTASIINDAPIVHDDPTNEDWRPQNHTKEFYGLTRLREGLIQSRNLVSIRLLQSLGIKKAIEFISGLGIDDDSLPRGLSLALGTNTLSPLDLATAYCVFPNGGQRVESHLITQILDSQNRELYVLKLPTELPQAMSEQTAYLITSMLQDVITHGTGRRAMQLGRTDLSGKTGTTNDQVDGWYAGYNRDLVVTTWMGFDDPRNIKEYAVSSALPMWIYFMEKALKGQPNHLQTQPPGLVTVRIDPKTGLLARPGQADAIFELFLDGTQPTQVASHVRARAENEIDDSLLDVDTLF